MKSYFAEDSITFSAHHSKQTELSDVELCRSREQTSKEIDNRCGSFGNKFLSFFVDTFEMVVEYLDLGEG